MSPSIQSSHASPSRRLLPLLALAAALAAPGAAAAKNILVIGPHPDDETLLAAGITHAGVANGDTVKVVVVTNGDAHGADAAPKREGESVAAAQLLGLSEPDVIFLGYPDGSLMAMYAAADPATVITSGAGLTATYAFRGLGLTDYHSYRHGTPGAYNHATMLSDLEELFEQFQPDEIYTTSDYDDHSDHQVVGLVVTEALVAARRGAGYPPGTFKAASTKLYEGMVWPPSTIAWPDLVGVTRWPDPSGAGGCAGDLPFPSPQPEEMTQLEWARAQRFQVPADMRLADDAANLKCRAILAYSTQAIPYLLSFARLDEFFWLNDFGANAALTATVTASSEDLASGQGMAKAVDGVIDGGAHEWASTELTGAWIRLDWAAPQPVAQVNLYGRQRTSQDVLAGRLDFSDGSHVDVPAFPPSGRLVPVTFAPKTASWVKFTVTSANPDGNPVGLSELQVLGATGSVPPNLVAGPYIPGAPFIGPGTGPDTITSAQQVALEVAADDLNGDALTYQWSLDGVAIPGATTPSVTFTPGVVGAPTVYAVAATVSDGTASASNVNFITVNPAQNGLTVAPASTQMGTAAVATVSLATPAGPGGVVVPVSSSDPAAAVPSSDSNLAAPITSVTVPQGSASASFFVFGNTVLADTPVTITATIGATPYTAPLTVTVAAVAPPVVPTGANLVSPVIGDASWASSHVPVTLNAGAAPDGTLTATQATVVVAGGHALSAQAVVVPGEQYLFSFYAKNIDGTAASYSVVNDCTSADIVATTPYISRLDSTYWTEINVSFTAPAGCNRVDVYPLRDSGVPVNVLLWGASVYKYGLPPADFVTLTPSAPSPHQIDRTWVPVTFTAFARGSAGYTYRFSVSSDGGVTFTQVQDYSTLSRWTWATPVIPGTSSPAAPGSYEVKVEVKTAGSGVTPDVTFTEPYDLVAAPPSPIAAVSPASLAFGTVTWPATATQDVTVTNSASANAALNVTGIAFTGANAGDFSQTNTCGTPVAVGGSCVISVTFAPTAGGTRVAALTFGTDDPYAATVVVGVGGTGVVPAATGVTVVPAIGSPSPHPNSTSVLFTATASGSSGYQYLFRLWDPSGGVTTVQDYSTSNGWTMPAGQVPGTYYVQVWVRTNSSVTLDTSASISYSVVPPPATGVTLAPAIGSPSPHSNATPVLFTATASGSSGYQYLFRLWDPSGSVTTVQSYSTSNEWTMPAGQAPGTYYVQVWVRTSSSVTLDTSASISYSVVLPPATGVTVVPAIGSPSPHSNATPVLFTATASGSSGYQYLFRLWDPSGSVTTVQDYSTTNEWTMPAGQAPGTYYVQVWVRTSSSVTLDTSASISYRVVLPL